MQQFRSLIFVSVLVGLIAGLAVTVLQYVWTEELILAAEVYEGTGEPATGHDHAAGTAAHAHDHEESGAAWAPADGIQRTGFTAITNILTATGFALVLNGLMQATGQPANWRRGLAWGLCGFAAVMLAPGLGLHPELPGSPAAPLADRQIWWIATVGATAVGLALLFLVRRPWAMALAIVLIALPHVIGAPALPEGVESPVPEELSRRFIAAAMLSSLLFWALIGALSGLFQRRFAA